MPSSRFLLGLSLFLLASSLFAATDKTPTPEQQRTNVLVGMARELVRAMEDHHGYDESMGTMAKYFKEAYEKRWGKNKGVIRVAVWPFRSEDIPVSQAAANELNTGLMSHLIKRSPKRYEYVARDALGAIIDDMQKTGALDDTDKDPIAALMENAQNIDVLITGNISLQGGKTYLSYKAVSMDGKVIGVVTPKQVPLEAAATEVDAATLSLNQAVRQAVKKLADQSFDVRELRLDGIRFEDSGLQPPFGRYLLEKVSSGLESKYSNALSGKALKVTDSRLNMQAITATRGIGVSAKQLKTHATETRGAYELSGSYWDLGDAVELRVLLKGAGDKTVSWTNSVRKDTLPDIQLRPDSDMRPLREHDNMGPVGFTLTTDKGDDPAYRIGDKMNLVMRLSRDAWVYCYYRQANGDTIPIFPNPHFWQLYKEPRLEAKRVHTIPGDTMFPFDLDVQPPAGEELLKCFATTRDVTRDLPRSMQGLALEPLPKRIDRKLSYIFQNLPKTGVTETSVVVTVVK